MMHQLEGVPVIDLAADHDVLVAEVAAACRDWGFFQLLNHGVDETLARGAMVAAQAFFDLAPEQKRLSSRSLDNPWGYYDRELTKNQRDRKEIFDYGQEGEIPWPRSPADFRARVQAYEAACHRLALQLVGLAAEGLGHPAAALCRHFGPAHSSFLRMNYYPREVELLQEADMPEAGELGISPHTDAGGLTVLLQDGVAGLQVYRDGDWYEVAVLPGALTINIGDMMQVWANDHYHAALHRVRGSTAERRYSIAYFLNPDYASQVQPLIGDVPHYRSFTWQEFRSLRAQGDYGDYGEEVQISQYRYKEG